MTHSVPENIWYNLLNNAGAEYEAFEGPEQLLIYRNTVNQFKPSDKKVNTYQMIS